MPTFDDYDYRIILGSLNFTAALLNGAEENVINTFKTFTQHDREILMNGILNAMEKVTKLGKIDTLPFSMDTIRKYYTDTESLR